MLKDMMHRQVLILATAQALFQIVSVAVMTIGGLAGAAIASSPRWATLPIAAMFLGTAVMMFPASIWMAQAINDMVIFVVGLACSFMAGGLLETMGWKQTNLVLAPWLLLAALSLAWLGFKQRNGLRRARA